MNKDSRIYVAGHTGLVGSAIVRKLKEDGFTNILTVASGRDRNLSRINTIDLRDMQAVYDFFASSKPHYVFMAGAKVGGIKANNNDPVGFLEENLLIQLNIMRAARLVSVKKLLFLGSSCIYPAITPQPIKEEYFMTGVLGTNYGYAAAKIAGIHACRAYREQYGMNYISLMPTNLYGPNDNFDLENSHVIPALIKKIHEAKENRSEAVKIWGTGNARREFMYVDDLADACLYFMENYDGGEIINIGTGNDITIKEVVKIIAEIVGYNGSFVYDSDDGLDGPSQKLLDVSKMKDLGFYPIIDIWNGLKKTYDWFLEQKKN